MHMRYLDRTHVHMPFASESRTMINSAGMKNALDSTDLKMAKMARISVMYYEQKLSQQEISQITGLTRTAISRILAQAVEREVVRFDISFPWRSATLEQALVERAGLSDAVVIITEDEVDSDEGYHEIQGYLGRAAERYISKLLFPDVKIALSWGMAIDQMIQRLERHDYPRSAVYQIIGATGKEEFRYNGPDLARDLADKLSGRYYPLHAPLVVESEAVRDALLRDANIRDTLRRAEHADFALTGIGTPRFTVERLVAGGYFTQEEADEILDRAVGEVCATYFDCEGCVLDLPVNRRVVGFHPDELEKVRRVIGVTGGYRKNEVLLGALKGGYVDILITNSTSALYLLEHLESPLTPQ